MSDQEIPKGRASSINWAAVLEGASAEIIRLRQDEAASWDAIARRLSLPKDKVRSFAQRKLHLPPVLREVAPEVARTKEAMAVGEGLKFLPPLKSLED